MINENDALDIERWVFQGDEKKQEPWDNHDKNYQTLRINACNLTKK